MPTILELGLLADSVYDSNPSVAGWTRTGFRPSGKGFSDAFQGAAFKKGETIVFAFKGTSQKRDVIADAKLTVGMNSSQYGDAGIFVKKLNKAGATSIYLTGHSLGGAIAQIVGNRQNIPFATFNAPGVGLASRNLDQMAVTMLTGSGAMRVAGSIASVFRHPMQAFQDLAALGRTVKGVNFRLGKDVVGNVGVHFGKVIELRYDGGSFDVLAKHKMGNMLKAIESNGYAKIDLDTLF